MEQFYVLIPEGGRFGTKWAYGEKVDPVNRGEPDEYCPECGAPVTGLKWLPPYRIRLSSANPNKWGDFLWGVDFALMISGKLLKLYLKEYLSGIRAYTPPVEITRVGKFKHGYLPDNLPTYHLLDIPWDGANQDDESSELEWLGAPREYYCSYHARGKNIIRKQKRIIIEPGSWKGGDLFYVRGAPKVLLITERFERILWENNIKNVMITPAEVFSYSDLLGKQ